MRPRPRAIGCGLLALACLPSAATAQTVHRCIGSHGEIAFSQAPCRPGSAAPQGATGPDPGATLTAETGCPDSAQAVQRRLEAALAAGDANALAGLVDWDGAGSSAARAGMARLHRLAAGPLLGIEVQPDGFLVRSGSQLRGQQEAWLALTPRGGCFWLREGVQRWPAREGVHAPDARGD